MKVLEVAPLREGLQKNTAMLNRLGIEMKSIEQSIEGLVALEDSLKGEGGNAIRSFYEECHLPFLQFHSTFQKNFVSIIQRMDAALDALEPNPSGVIRESFLEGEIEQGLTEIAQITESLTDEANSIMDQVADIVGLPHLDDSDVQEGVRSAKIKRDDTVTALHEFDTNQTNALMPIETDLATMDSWLSDIEGLFSDGTTDIDFTMERWAALSAENSLKTDLAHRTAEMAGVSETEHINYRSGMVLDALLTGQDPFQITYESVEGPTAYLLYDSYIFTTFPGMSSRARLRHGSAAEEESGFLYSLKKSWRSIQEIGHDSIEGFKVRGDKAYDSVYDFTNHVTLGISDAIWSGSKERTAKRKDSVGDYLNYWTLGFTDTVVGAVNPDDPYSKEHWANSFGLATSFTGVGKVVTTKPTSSVSGTSKPRETNQSAGANKGTGEIVDAFRKNPADPVKEVLGAGKKSHPVEWNKIIDEIESQGGEVIYKEGTMAYSPSSGKPGQLIIDENSSISALIHEYTHYIDDKSKGFPGMSYHFQTKNRVKMELNAYMKEVEFAESIGRRDIANMLFENYIEERALLTNHLK